MYVPGPWLTLRALDAAGLQPSDVDVLIPHQANLRIVESIAKRLRAKGARDDMVVADDIYNIHGRYAWAANEQLYSAHPSKPYAIAEWANWGLDDPAFVVRIAQFARTHARVELLAYYNGRPGSPFDIASQPRSQQKSSFAE